MPDPIEDLTDLVTTLQARVDALDDEVRTRRRRGGRRRRPTAGSCCRRTRASPRCGSTPRAPTPSIELYAVDAIDADGPEVGVAIVVDGDVVAVPPPAREPGFSRLSTLARHG